MDQPAKPSPSPSPSPYQPSLLPQQLHQNDADDQPSPLPPQLHQNGTDDQPSPLPPQLHQNDADEEDENVKQLRECSSVYIALQDCLVNTDRNWKSCQKEVQALKACNDRKKR